MGTITKKIGTAGGPTRDYSTLQAWEDALPANLVTDGNDQVGELYNDGEFVVAVPLNIAGETTSSTFGITLRCATGQSWRDNASKLTNRLAYNAANGVAIRATGSYGTALIANSDNVTIDGIQLKATGSPMRGVRLQNAGGMLRNAIVQSKPANATSEFVAQVEQGSKIVNSVVIADTANAVMGISLLSSGLAINCTVVRPSNYAAGGIGIRSNYGTAVAKSSAIFGFSTAPTGTFAEDGHNVTDATSAPGSTSNLTSKTYASQFVQTSNAGGVEDYRVLSTADLVGAGVRDAANTGDVDALGQTRSTTAPTAGAMEYVSSGPAAATGTFAATLAVPTMSASGAVVNAGAFAASLASPTFAASGIVATPPVGSFAATLAAPSLAASGLALNPGIFSATLDAPTFAASGTAAPHATGTFPATLAAPAMSAFGYLGAVAPAAPIKPYRWRVLRRHFTPQ